MKKTLIILSLCLMYFTGMAQEPMELPRPDNIKDGINYMQDGRIIFCLFAPYKHDVYLIGDFNNWEKDVNYLMKKDVVDADHVYWWYDLRDLDSNIEYAFQYLVDGDLRIADPYAEKILDPINDQWIPSSIYPNLKSYPAGQSKIASVVYPHNMDYEFEVSDFQRPAKEELTIYELHLRDFLGQHDYNTLTDTLSYLQQLGINAIELMPINEFEGNSSWGYNPSFYLAPDKYYGPASDLKRFIDTCHKQGIAVIIDLVLNHSYDQSPLVQLYFDGDNPTAQNPWYNSECISDYCWGNDFNHESEATRYFVDRVTEHWLKNYHFDGIRFDFTQGFSQRTGGNNWAYDASRIANIERMADHVWQASPGAYVILEHWTENSEEIELSNYGCMLWGNVTDKYMEAAMGYNSGDNSDFSWGYFKNRNWTKPHLVSFMESHDEERIMFKTLQWGNSSNNYDIKNLDNALNRSALCAAFLFTQPGPKMMWQFQELGYDYSIDYNDRVGEKPIRWDYFILNENRKSLYNNYKKLIRLRANNEVFTSAETSLTMNLQNSSGVKSMTLQHASMSAVVVGNFGVESSSITVDFPFTGTWYSCFSSEDINVAGEVNINLAPGEYRVYTSNNIRSTLAYHHNNKLMYAAGTFNGWAPDLGAMTLSEDYTWVSQPLYLATGDYEFKFTNNAEWTGQDWGNASGLTGNASPTTGGGNNISFTITTSGYYSLTFNDYNMSYSVSKASGVTSREADFIAPNSIKLYPNPSIGQSINISNNNQQLIKNITIYSFNGQKKESYALNTRKNTINIATNLHAGIYLINIQLENITATRKLVVTE